MEFPKRVYTQEEVKKAKELIDKGYKHRLIIKGSPEFKEKVSQALELVKLAGYDDFLRTYIRSVEEIDGLTQLRVADAAIWANKYAVDSAVDAASVFIQKAMHMKEYLELKHYYSGEAEKRSFNKRIEFIQTLKNRTQDRNVLAECDRLLKLWRDGSLVY